MVKVRYHMTPKGSKPCHAKVRRCPYGEEAHFYDEAATSTTDKADPQYLKEDNKLTISDVKMNEIIKSDNWGAQIADLIDKHWETVSKPQQISWKISWEDEAIEGDPETKKLYVFEATPRLDSTLNAYTNTYRVGVFDPNVDKEMSLYKKVMWGIIPSNQAWSYVPDGNKWEVGYGKFTEESNSPLKDLSAYKEEEANERAFLGVLNNLNDLDSDKLIKRLQPSDVKSKFRRAATLDDADEDEQPLAIYENKSKKLANNIISSIEAVERELQDPYDAHDRGLGFYMLDSNNRAIVDENLRTTTLRGRILTQFGVSAHRWIRGLWRTDSGYSHKRGLHEGDRQERVLNNTKGMPYKSPMTFWTNSTPDGVKWELGLDIHTTEEGSHRVRYFKPDRPETPETVASPTNSIEGYKAMVQAMETYYGEKESWSKDLKREIKVLEGLAIGHNLMKDYAVAIEETVVREKEAKAAGVYVKESHDSLFGKELSDLWG